jgi:hypothetical protein
MSVARVRQPPKGPSHVIMAVIVERSGRMAGMLAQF